MLGVVVLIMSVLYLVSFYYFVLYNNMAYFTLSFDVAVWSGECGYYLETLDCWFPIDGNVV